MAINPNAKIIAMGDLNDDPINKSLKDYCKTVGKKEEVKDGKLYDPMEELYRKGIGSLAYGDRWNLFDQMIFSPAFVSRQVNIRALCKPCVQQGIPYAKGRSLQGLSFAYIRRHNISVGL